MELLSREHGEAEYATGTRGEPGTGRYLEPGDETDVDLLLERVADEVRGRGARHRQDSATHLRLMG